MRKTMTSLARLDDKRLLAQVDGLTNEVWTCRRRGWVRKLEQAKAQLANALRELTRRIDADQERKAETPR